jgi:hypothetical protein
MARALVLTSMLVLVILPAGPLEAGTTGRSILSKKKLEEFYAAGGRNHAGKKVHIHLSASLLKKKGKTLRLPGGKIALVFENRSVPVLVNPRNVYFKRLKRKKDVTGLLCIKGRVIRPAWDLKGRCFLWVDVIKTYGGKLDKG